VAYATFEGERAEEIGGGRGRIVSIMMALTRRVSAPADSAQNWSEEARG